MAETMGLILVGMAAAFAGETETPANGPALTLVCEGKPAAAIVLAETPTRSARFAAAELQYHVQKITGATLPIVTSSARASGVRIFVGESSATRALGVKNADFAPQEYLVGCREPGVLLVGRDKADFGPMDYADGDTFPDGFDEQGSCYAVYDFLERWCGVRWYLPTELGLVYVPRNTLVVAGPEIRRQPFMRHRLLYKDLNIPADLCGDALGSGKKTPQLAPREALLWSRRNRLGGEPYACNHSLYGYYDRFLKTHLEWFAQGYAGKPPQMCYTSPGLLAQVVQDARDYFDGKPSRSTPVAKGDYFSVMPMDNNNYCKCPSCRRLLKAEETTGDYLRARCNDRASDYVFSFVNQVAREVRKTHPDKHISTSAYNWYGYPPAAERLESNLTLCITLRWRDVYDLQRLEANTKRLESWHSQQAQVTKFAWLYLCYPGAIARENWYRCFPPFFATAVVKQMQEYSRLGIRGVFIEPFYLAGDVRSVLMDQLELYLAWKLADNPQLDGMALRDEFFERYYGAAARPMRELYLGIERVYSDPVNYPSGIAKQTEEVAWGRLGTEARMREFAQLVAAAHAAAQTKTEQQRVACFDQGIWQHMLSGRKTYLEKVDQRRAAPLKTAPVARASAVSLAGDLAKIDWAKASLLADWRTLRGQPIDRKIEGRAAHDGTFLYLQLTDFMNPKDLDAPRGNVPTKDKWVLFFAQRRASPYRRLEVNQQGIYRRLPNDNQATDWQTSAVVESHTNASDRWTVELALPLAELLPAAGTPAKELYFNAVRCTSRREPGLWSPSFRDSYETPLGFGKLVLGE